MAALPIHQHAKKDTLLHLDVAASTEVLGNLKKMPRLEPAFVAQK
jgi:hypothetical protein